MAHTQNKRLYSLLHSTRLMEQKAALVLSYTAGRSESSKDLTEKEAIELCSFLQGQLQQGSEAQRMDNMRKKLISLAYEMGWSTPGNHKLAIERINAFLTGQHGKYKKELNKLTYKELVHETTQFNQMYIKHLKAVL